MKKIISACNIAGVPGEGRVIEAIVGIKHADNGFKEQKVVYAPAIDFGSIKRG